MFAVQPRERDQALRDSEREHDLADHKRTRGVDSGGGDHQRGQHRNGTAQPQRHRAPQEPAHDHLTGERPDR